VTAGAAEANEAATHHWVTTWAASAHGPYPLGAPVAQPDLRAALPDPSRGAVDQSMRMVVRPALWASRLRLRISNVCGDRALSLRGLGVALHAGGGAVLPNTTVRLSATAEPFAVPAGQARWTEAFTLPWVDRSGTGDARGADVTEYLHGRELALSWAVQGASGPMTWHAKAMATSYLAAPGDLQACHCDRELAFPHTTTSWFFVDAVDAWLPQAAHACVAFGDSLTDGTATTLNGHDRWPDVLRRELWAAGLREVCVVNAGIGGNQVVGPAGTSAAAPSRGGPSAIDRLERDVLSLSGVRQVIWIEGINDFSDNGQAEAEAVIAGLQVGVARLRAAGIRVVGATLGSALGSTRPGHGSQRQDARRRAFNALLRQRSVFDALVDLDAVMTDAATGAMPAAFNGDSTLGEPGDGVHPNRAGHACMAQAVMAQLRRAG
jgi:lysophospholipase L1-like esterase